MEILDFKPDDIDDVFDIQRAAYKRLYEKYHDQLNPYIETIEQVFAKYMRAGVKGYVFHLNDVPVGAVRIYLYPETKTAKISALAVDPRYQGRGIAQYALTVIENKHAEIKRWVLDTIFEETKNRHLYEKLGYKRTGSPRKINDMMTLVSYEKIKPT